MRQFPLLLAVLISLAQVCEAAPQRQIRDPLWRESNDGELQAGASNFTLKWHENKLDHFDSEEKRTFRSRYWVNDQYYSWSSRKIFLYICGEWTCRPPSEEAAAFAFGIKMHAKLMVLEHRYYGDSQPFTDEEGGWSYENLKWLSSR